MSIQENIINDNYITSQTALPLYTEQYSYTCHGKEGLHSHAFFEIGIILSGSLYHHTESGMESLHKGCVYFIPIGSSHSLESESGFTIQNLYLLPRILFHNSSLSPLLHDFLLYFAGLHSSNAVSLVLPPQQLHSLCLLLDALECSSLSPSLQDTFLSNILYNILLILCDSFCLTYPECKLRKDERVYTVLDIIQEKLSYPTDEIIKMAAAKLSLHPQYLNRLIKKELHTTLSALIIDTKLEKSCELLLENAGITETANALAFYDHSHFSKFFLRKTGVSPSQYQRRNLPGHAPDYNSSRYSEGHLPVQERNIRLK